MALRHDLSLSRRQGPMAPWHFHLFTPSMNQKGLQCTCGPTLPSYIFSVISAANSFKQPLHGGFRRQVDTCDVQEFAAEMRDAKRPAASNRALLKLPLRGAYFWSVLYNTQSVLRTHFWSEFLRGCALIWQVSSEYVTGLQAVLTTMTFSSLAQHTLSERYSALRNINSPSSESACQGIFSFLFNSLKNIRKT